MLHQERARAVKLKLLRLRQRDSLAGSLKTSQPLQNRLLYTFVYFCERAQRLNMFNLSWDLYGCVFCWSSFGVQDGPRLWVLNFRSGRNMPGEDAAADKPEELAVPQPSEVGRQTGRDLEKQTLQNHLPHSPELQNQSGQVFHWTKRVLLRILWYSVSLSGSSFDFFYHMVFRVGETWVDLVWSALTWHEARLTHR